MKAVTPRLRRDVEIRLEYADSNELGSPLTPKLNQNLHFLFQGIRESMARRGYSESIRNSEQILVDFWRDPSRRALRTDDNKRITPSLLYPDPRQVNPSSVTIMCQDTSAVLNLDCTVEQLHSLHDLFAALRGDVARTVLNLDGSDSLFRQVLQSLSRQGLLDINVRSDADVPREWIGCDVTFVGHNTVVVRSSTTAIIVDPWLLPWSSQYPADYQPTVRSELGAIDALLITHSHPDHFDPATLLQFNRNIRLLVPAVERESLLSCDIALRLRQLGFSQVEILEWWQGTQVGDIKVFAVPFHGEQPTNTSQLCPEVRNVGNCYLVRTPRMSCAFVADSGKDRSGDVRDMALEAYRRWGSIDILFSGYRGWSLYPLQYAGSSVPAYLLFVPPELYAVRQSIMSDASQAVDTAEAWHARYLAPYADGGAPWFWNLGLGPVLSTGEVRQPTEWLYFDPLPERSVDSLRIRSAITPEIFVSSPVMPLLLRPGESARLVDSRLQIVEADGHRWPWGQETQRVIDYENKH